MLTIVMPFYRKDVEFQFIFSNYNFEILNTYENIELLIVVDDPFGYKNLINFLENFTRSHNVNFSIKVILNEVPHDWRPPCIAINVGIVQARHEKILVLSPETIITKNNINQLMLSCKDNAFSIGLVQFIKTSDFSREKIDALMLEKIKVSAFVPYGSICFTKNQADSVGGYDEDFLVWGGDDDDFRSRLKLAGFKQNLTLAKFFHINFDRHDINGFKDKNKELEKEIMSKKISDIDTNENIIANNGIYGESYDKVIFSSEVLVEI